MGRVIAVIVVLVALALAINYMVNRKHADEPIEEPEVPVISMNEEVVEGPALASAENATVEETATEEAPAKPNGPPPPFNPDPMPEAKSESKPESPVDEATTEPTPDGAANVEPEEVMLGEGELLTGIPGDGELTLEQISAWLDDSKNHVPLKPQLPLGLSAGQSTIVGLEENPMTRAKIELGRQLYFDSRLSVDSSISCASCHDPGMGYASDTTFGVGVKGQEGNRNSPTAYNRILSAAQFWDGRAPTLEEQAKGPIANPIEMSNTHEVCVQCIAGIPGYRMQFEKIFSDGVTIDNVAQAIASFERAIVTGTSPWDYYEQLRNFEKAYEADLEDLEALKEDDPEFYEEYMELKKASDAHPISDSAKRGGELFFSDKAGCTQCHVGANYTDEKYHNLGVGMEAEEPDLGRYTETKDEKDKGAFKTPTIRNVAQTAPYMHDGSQKTLEEVVEWYDKGGHPNPHLSDKIKKLDLTDQEKKDLVEFMRALTGPLPEVETGRLPESTETGQEN